MPFEIDQKEKKNRIIQVDLSNDRGGSRTTAKSKMEPFVIIVNGFQPLAIIIKRSILDVAAVLDPPLNDIFKYLQYCFTVLSASLREKYPNTQLFLIRFFFSIRTRITPCLDTFHAVLKFHTWYEDILLMT